MNTVVVFMLSAAVLVSAGTAIAQGAQPAPSASAARIHEPIHLDGRFDEQAWRAALPIGPLRQREPVEEADATEATEIRLVYDDDALYVAVECHDRTARDIVATQLTRDAELDVDDYVMIVLDPFFDHRNGFFFQVNPSGARSDGQVSNNAEELNSDWDGIWNAAARRTESGWQAEIAIPFKTLRFKPEQTTWGLNVERQIKRKDEVNRWSSPRLDVWIGNLAEAGRLEGLDGVRQGLGLDLRPYAGARHENSDGSAAGGFDLFKSITTSLNASLTVNTDFAETEADARQINLTRFPLFFPEKRAFFLEGAGVFDVAGLAGNDDLLPFFTRRIGLLSGEEVSIAVGTKVVGRQGAYNIGVVDVQTRDLDDNPLTGQNLLGARVSRNLLRQSWIGGIVTHGNPAGAGDNTLVGADARFATSTFRGSKNLSLDLFALRTSDEQKARADYAAGFKLDYPNDDWDVALTWKQIGNAFVPRLGFVPRAGIRKTNVGVVRGVRPQRWGVRQLQFELRPEHITNLENRVENWRILATPLNLRTESGDELEWSYIPQFERLDAPFEIAGVIIAPGSYRTDRYRAQIETASKRPWVIELEIEHGRYYSGTRREIQIGVGLKPNTHILLELETQHNDVTLPSGAFSTLVHTARVNYNFTPNVSWANLVQYDTESRIAGVQSRFRWILKPGNDLFVVLNRGWFRTFDGAYEQAFNRESVKLQYTFRL
jgi:hypothetical protein